jgi:hypothetical protein
LFGQALGLGHSGKHFKAIEMLNKAIELDPGEVVSTFLCEIFLCQFFEERQILTDFSYRV